MNPLTVLILQARAVRDPMLLHETTCLQRRFGDRPVRLIARNAAKEMADPGWLKGVDAVIVGGSGDYSVHHPFSRPWVTPLRNLLDSALNSDLPGFGICFGHQLLGFHLGGQIVTEPDGEEVGTLELSLTEQGHESRLFGGLGSSFQAQTGHADIVDRAPAGTDLLASGRSVVCQAIRVRGAPFFSTQFHPDLTWEEARERFLANKTDEQGRVHQDDLVCADAFRPGSDGAIDLLGRFVDLVVSQRS